MKELPHVFLKVLERINRIIFWGLFWVFASENTPADKKMFKVDNKGMSEGCYLGVFIISLENIFKVCGRVSLP